MNDLTKEELIYLLKCVDPKYGIYFEAICKKLQSIIDNYCEHDCKTTIWQCQITACSKCGFPSSLKEYKK